LRQIDAAGPRQLGAKHGGEQSAGQKAVSNPLLENGSGGELIVEMDRIDIAREFGKRRHIRIGDDLGDAGLHARRKILQIVAVAQTRLAIRIAHYVTFSASGLSEGAN